MRGKAIVTSRRPSAALRGPAKPALAIVALVLGGAAVLGAGVWLGGQRAAAQQNSAPEVQARERVSGPRPALAPRSIAPGLAEDLRDRDPLVRRNAIADLAAAGGDARVLGEASRDADLNVAVAATQGLARMYRDGQLPATELVARTTAETPPKVRIAAINGLGLVAAPQSARALTALLARGSEIDRRGAAIVLVHQEPALAVPALIGALRDSDEIVRANAREALRSIARGRDLGEDAGAWQRWWQSRSR
jgi:HEAT repeat protein